MKTLWVCFVVFLAIVGYVASRPADNSVQKQAAIEIPANTDALKANEKNKAVAALTAAKDVKTIATAGTLLLVMPYGPCGTVMRMGKVWIWNGDASPAFLPSGYLNINGEPVAAFDTQYEAMAAAFTGCEFEYQSMKAQRDLNQRALEEPPTK